MDLFWVTLAYVSAGVLFITYAAWAILFCGKKKHKKEKK